MSSFVFHMSGKQCQKAFQYRMIMTILIIYAKGHLGKTGYGNVAQTGVSRMGNVRIEGITNLSFYKSKGTFNIFCDEPLFWGKSHKNTVLDSKNGIRKLAGRTSNKVSGELFWCKGFISGQRVLWRADTGHMGRREFSVP